MSYCQLCKGQGNHIGQTNSGKKAHFKTEEELDVHYKKIHKNANAIQIHII